MLTVTELGSGAAQPVPTQTPAPALTTVFAVVVLTVCDPEQAVKFDPVQVYVRSPFATSGPVVGLNSALALAVSVALPVLIVVRTLKFSDSDPAKSLKIDPVCVRFTVEVTT